MKNRPSKIAVRTPSRHRLAILYSLSSILVALTVGCMKETKPVAMTSHAPLIVDDAMQQRQWPRSVAHFANGETPAGPTGFVLQHDPKAPKWLPAVTDGPLFGMNVCAMPIGYLFTAPWTPTIYPSGVTEPSYNAMPPLPAK